MQEVITELTQENIILKKVQWGDLKNKWVEPNVRDSIVETITAYNQKTEISVRKLLCFLGLCASKFYQWKVRYGLINRHNGKIPVTGHGIYPVNG